MENYKEIELNDMEQDEENDNVIGHVLMYPEEGITYINDNNDGEEYTFRCWTEADILNLKDAVNKIGEDKFFENINTFFENENEILKVDNLEFEYRNMIMVGECFVMLNSSSTINKKIRRK